MQNTYSGRGRASGWLVAVAMAVACAGCGPKSDRLPVFPVSGTLVYKGQPLPNALVAFHPTDKSDPRATSSRATTDAEGKFSLSTYEANDGAPAGQYKVTVECYKLKGTGKNLEPGPNFLPPKYANPATTSLSFQVEPGAGNAAQLAVE